MLLSWLQCAPGMAEQSNRPSSFICNKIARGSWWIFWRAAVCPNQPICHNSVAARAQAYMEPEDYVNLVSREDEHAKSGFNVPSTQAVLIALLVLTASATMFLSGCGSSSSQPQSQPTLTSIAVTPPTASVAIQGTQQFAAKGTFSDGSTKDLTSSSTWSSSATNVATISPGGLATGVAAGTTTITAASGTVKGSTTLTVTTTTVALVSIAVAPPNPSIASGSQFQFTATGSYSDGSNQDLTSTATWNSSSSTVATITADGLAIAATAGSTTISAKSGSITGSTTLTVSTTGPIVAISEWLEFVGDGSDGPYSCASGSCNLGGEHWFSSFNVATGAKVVPSGPNTPLVVRSTGSCTVAGTISNSGGSVGNSGEGDFGGGGGGGGGGTAAGSGGQFNVGDAAIEIVSGGSGGAGGGGNGGAAGTVGSPAPAQYRLLLSGGTPWPVGGGAGGRGGSAGGAGGLGGAPVILVCQSITFTGMIDVSGGAGAASPGSGAGAGGGGGGGYVILAAPSYSANTGTINTAGGPGGGACSSNSNCGSGGAGGSGWSVAITIP